VKALHQTYHQSAKAPELYGDYWFNSAPLSIAAVQGQNILLYFWNYSSPSSLRILPLMKEWYATYAELGLVCIGVHSPEFSFATNPRKVDEFLKKQSIEFPVVADNDRLIAGAYRISNFPTLVLISANGNIYDMVAESFSVLRLERSIQYLLRQSGFFGELPPLRSMDSERSQEHTAHEITTGYLHGSLGNVEGYSPELPAHYEDPGIYIEGKFYAHGIWRAERNAFHYEGEPNDGYLICQSVSENIDVLVGSEQKSSLRIKVDDTSMLIGQMGSDIQRDPKGNSIVTVGEPQFVSVFRGTQKERHSVQFIPGASGITFYMFSFFKEQGSEGGDQIFHNN
jgi:thiol-disulfide isomerase/thioredoxin